MPKVTDETREFKNAKGLMTIITAHLEAIDDGLLGVTLDDQVGDCELDVLVQIGKKERRFTVKVEDTTDQSE